MRKLCFYLMATLAGAICAPAHAENVLDPYLRLMLRESGSATMQTAKALGVSEVQAISVFIKTTDIAQLKGFLEKSGGTLHAEFGDIVTATVPTTAVAELEHLSGVVYVEQAKPLQTKLDLSRPLVGTDAVHTGTKLPQGYDGTGVIVGIVDSGIDWEHPAFGGRILALWDQLHAPAVAWKPPTELPNAYGIECLPQHFTTGTCPARDDLGHGTHVAGIAASSSAKYKGVAPAADLIVVDMGGARLPSDADMTPTFDWFTYASTAVVDGMQYIFKKAETLGRPAVINLSVGLHFGAHDGSSLFEQAINTLLEGKEGRAIVVAAGNENNQAVGPLAGIHAGYAPADETFATEFMTGGSQSHAILLDAWSSPGSTLSFAVGVDGYQAYEVSPSVTPGATVTFQTADRQLEIILDASETTNPLNGKQHAVISIAAVGKNDGIAPTAAKYVFDLVVSGTGKFDAWLPVGGTFTRRSGAFARTGYAYRSGDSHHTVAAPATAASVLSVASFASRDQLGYLYPDDRFIGYKWTPPGEISPFSSRGPSLAPSGTGQKPDVAAPGEWIVSALSRHARGDFVEAKMPMSGEEYVLLEGTSMAAPHVAGAVALLFQRNPHLKAAAVKHLLCLNATIGPTAGNIPNNAWGFGQLNIAKAMENFDTTPLDSPLSYSEVRLAEREGTAFPDFDRAAAAPSESGGCSLVHTTRSIARRHAALPIVLGFFFFFVLTVSRLSVGMDPAGRRGGFILLFSIFTMSCGGSGGPSENGLLQADLSLPNALNLKANRVIVSSDYGTATYVAVDQETLQAIGLAIPLERFHSGEIIGLGGDNLYSRNPDEALLSVITFSDKEMTTPVSAYVALEGRVTMTEAAWNNGALVSGTVADAILYQVDLTNSLVKRGTNGTPLAGSFSSTVKEGGVLNPIILSTTPNGGPRGTTVTVTGFNLSGVTGASICEHKMSATQVSPQRVTFTVDTLPCVEGTVNLITGNSMFPIESKRPFRLEFSDTVVKPLPHPVDQVVYDMTHNLLFLSAPDLKLIDRFSVSDGKFLAPIVVPFTVASFDINQRGDRLIVCDANVGQIAVIAVGPADAGTSEMIAIPEGRRCTGTAFGQGDRALLVAEKIAEFNLGDSSVTFPSAIYASVTNGRFLKSVSGKTVVLQSVGTTSSKATVYLSATDGSFAKGKQLELVSNDSIVAVNPAGDRLWGYHRVYGSDLQSVGDIYDFYNHTLAWQEPSEYVRNIAFSPDDAVAVLSVGAHIIDILDANSRKMIAAKIPILGTALNPLRTFVSADGATLMLVDETNLYLVDLRELLK